MTNPIPTPTTSHQQPTTNHQQPIPNPEFPIPSPRTRANRANSQHSTGPRTPAGKHRSSLNALRHGLTAASAVLASEDPAAYENHRRRFFDEYQPGTPTESELVAELADTAWRLNRIPLLEAELLSQTPNPQSLIPLLSTLGLHSQRLSRQFHRALATLRDIQSTRRDQERRQLKEATALLELHKHKQIPWDPAADGFVFSKDEVERYARPSNSSK